MTSFFSVIFLLLLEKGTEKNVLGNILQSTQEIRWEMHMGINQMIECGHHSPEAQIT